MSVIRRREFITLQAARRRGRWRRARSRREGYRPSGSGNRSLHADALGLL